MSGMLRANEVFCSIRSFCEKPCASSASLFGLVLNCLRSVSRVKDLKQWASVFSATCGFRNHRIKNGYEESRVTSTRHDASCA